MENYTAALIDESINLELNVASLYLLFNKLFPEDAEAFNIALNIENSAGEIHFEKFMNKETELKIDHIFQQLNKDDKDHANRISSYMNRNSIPLQSEK